MHSVTLYSAVFLFTSVLSQPIETRAVGFTVQQVARPRKRPTFAQRRAKVHKKFGISIADVSSRSPQTGSAPAVPEQFDQAYLLPVEIGGKTFDLDLDTGSSDLWVFSTGLPDTQETGHTVYDTSTGTKQEGLSWKIGYGDGSGASGDVYSGSVTIGGVTVTDQAIEAAETISSSFVQDVDSDGLLGAGFGSINTVTPTKQKTFMENLIESGKISKPVFASLLLHNQTGSYDFGFIDNTKFTGDIDYEPVDNSKGFWTVDTNIGPAIVDTGSSIVYITDSELSAYYGKVSGAELNSLYGLWTVPCSAALPDYNLKIGNTNTVIAGKYINYGPLTNGLNGPCMGGLQTSAGMGFNLLGDVWIKNKYIIWDQTPGNVRLGIAKIPYLS